MSSKILQINAAYQKNVEHLLHELSAFHDEVLNRPSAGGGWSAVQTIHHLILTEELSLGYIRKKLSFKTPVPKSGITTEVRSAALWFYLHLPLKFKAPKNVATENLPQFSTFADTRDRWLRIRAEWTGFLEQLPPILINKAVYRHPFVGRLSWPGMLHFFQDHFKRHRKQIWRALK